LWWPAGPVKCQLEGLDNKLPNWRTVKILQPTHFFESLQGQANRQNYQPEWCEYSIAIMGQIFLVRQKSPSLWGLAFFPMTETDFLAKCRCGKEDNWKLLTNDKLERTELYNIVLDWAEQEGCVLLKSYIYKT